MKFCKNCSASLEDDAVFCTECGTSLADDTFSSNSPSSPSSSYEGAQGTIPNYNDNQAQSGSTYNQQQYSAPQGSNPGVPWLIVNIVAIFCCSGIFAIPGLVLAILSMTSFNAGNIEDSKQKAKTAMILTFCGMAVGIIINILIGAAIFRSGSYDYSYY